MAQVEQADGPGQAASLERVREHLERPGLFPGEEVFFAEEDGAIAGYVEVRPELEIGRAVVEGAVGPAHRGRGIGGRLLDEALAHSRRLGALVAHVPVAQGMAAGQRLLEGRGLAVVRRHWQMALVDLDVERPQVPPGLVIDHLRVGQEAELCALQNAAFAGSWGFHPNTVEEVARLLVMATCRHQCVLTITEGGAMVAYCWTAEHPRAPQRGCIRMVGVHPSRRGRGLGRAVLLAAIDYLGGQGKSGVELSVDSRNTAATRLYRSLGFRREGVLLWYQAQLT